MEETSMNDILKTVLPNLNELISANVVVGKEIKTEDGTTIIPVSKVSFGYGAGKVPTEKTKFGGGTGGGVSVEPVGFLVINKDGVRLMQISSADNTADRVVNMVPQVIDKVPEMVEKVQGIIKGKKNDASAENPEFTDIK